MDKRQIVETIFKIIIIFLSALLLLSVLNGRVTLFMVVGALGTTYIFIYHWRRRMSTSQPKRVQVK